MNKLKVFYFIWMFIFITTIGVAYSVNWFVLCLIPEAIIFEICDYNIREILCSRKKKKYVKLNKIQELLLKLLF